MPARNGSAASGSIGTLSGHRLKFRGDNEAEGIFFISVNGDGTYKASVVQRNTPKELVFQIPPELPAGAYRIEVRALYGEKDMRTGRLRKTVRVG